MKKILILALTFLMLSVLPAFAAGTEVEITGTQNIAEDLFVTINTTREDFVGATVKIDGKTAHTLDANGAGMYTVTVKSSEVLDRAGSIVVAVVANYSGSESETIEKTVLFTKMAETVTKFTKANTWLHNVTAGWGGSVGNTTAYNLDEFGNETDDTGSFLFKWREPFVAGDTRVGLQFGPSSNADEGVYYIEHDIYFMYGEDEKTVLPKGSRFYNYFRTETSTSGSPQFADTLKSAEGSIDKVIDVNTGKFIDGSDVYTNTWYRIKIVVDKYTKDAEGKYTGGLRYYIAEADASGNFGEYRLFANYPNVYMKGICGWRYEFKASDSAFSFAFKNFKFTALIPKSSWYLNNTEYNDKSIKLTFSEDMGELTPSKFKFLNKLNKDENGDVVYEEIPVSSVVPEGENQYVLTLPKALLYGKDYEIRLANNFKSTQGSVAFKEPAVDENGDGFWNFSTVTAPKYPLNISLISDEGNASVVKINNTDVADKYVAVCWYNQNGSLADFDIVYIAEVTAEDTFTFKRNNSKSYDYIKGYVFDFNADPQSSESGKIVVYDNK